VAKLWNRLCNPSEIDVSYSWRLDEAARVFVTSLVYAVLNWQVSDMASAGASGTVTVEDQRSYIKIETLRGKNPIEIHSALREVCGEQTVERIIVSRWATRFREGRITINDDPRPGRPKTSTDERRVKLVADFLAEDRRATCEEISQATGISPTSLFCILTKDLQKRKICARWVPHCLLLNRNRNAWKLQHYWNKDLTLKVKHSCIELSLPKRGLETMNQSWNRSQTCGEVQAPRDPKKFRRARSKVKQMISFVYDHRGIIVTRVPCGTSVKAAYYRDWMQKLRRNMHKTRLARGWATHFARQCTPAPGEGCDRFAE